ncbi:hypothetical protein ACO0LO_19025 [Undibacterium sp. TJN25]|uniref:hypothetical protein n=1 Tax=Undibacterium sp. TJN25 TaxID=3413056 RepID=UPI003BF0A942
MNDRRQQFYELSIEARWLDIEHAAHAYRYALGFSSNARYGLKTDTVSDIESLIIESYSVANSWIKDRLGGAGTVQIVYGHDDVCVISTQDFLNNWQNIFAPSRDDAIVLHNLNESILFYCHEDELEFGQRRT